MTDLPPSIHGRIQAATLRAVFGAVCAIGEPGMLRGRRYGNVVLAAGRSLPVARLARIAARDEVRARVVEGPDLDAFIGGVGPMRRLTRPAEPAPLLSDPDGQVRGRFGVRRSIGLTPTRRVTFVIDASVCPPGRAR